MPLSARGFHTNRAVSGDEQYGFDAPAWSRFHWAQERVGWSEGVASASVTVVGQRTLRAVVNVVAAGLHITGTEDIDVPTATSNARLVVSAIWSTRTVKLELKNGIGEGDYIQEPGDRYQVPLRLLRTGGAAQITTAMLTNISPRPRRRYPLSAVTVSAKDCLPNRETLLERISVPHYGWPYSLTVNARVRMRSHSLHTGGRAYLAFKARPAGATAQDWGSFASMTPNLTANQFFDLDNGATSAALTGAHDLDLVLNNTSGHTIAIDSGQITVAVDPA